MEQEQQAAEPKKRFGFFKTLAVGVVVLATAGVAYMVATSGPTTEQKEAIAVGDRIVADVRSKNTRDAYSLAAPALQQGNTEDSFAASINEVSPRLQGKARLTGKTFYEAIGANDPAEAILVYTIATDKGDKYIKVVLQKGESWRMLNFRSSDTNLDATNRS